LLLTFVCFFIFVGNLTGIDTVKNFITFLIIKRELFVSVILSQVISNVPAAVLLSSFTKNYHDLIIGTNIGGLGTLIASLASLISFKYYVKSENAKIVRYLLVFSVINVAILILLYVFTIIWY
jgi:Na+/H+ antiporter NhaD/arsenite permease-like protein